MGGEGGGGVVGDERLQAGGGEGVRRGAPAAQRVHGLGDERCGALQHKERVELSVLQ